MSLGFVTPQLAVNLLLPFFVAAQPGKLTRFEFHRGLMGTQFDVVFYASDSLLAHQAYAAVSARMDSLNQVMSDYLDGSEINRLSAASGSGQWIHVSADLFHVLQKAQTMARLSQGRFDPTVGPLSQLWRRAVRRNEFPTKATLRQARRTVGYRLMELDSLSRSVRLIKANMRLDVGGIGQGFANDEAILVLRKFGIRSALLDIGGDILVGDPPPDNSKGWRIGIGVEETGKSDTIVFLKNSAITTSGDTHRFLNYKGRRYSHIMDPRSGLGLRRFVRATVMAPDGYQADTLTKVFSVAGIRRSRHLLKKFPGATLLILENKNGRVYTWQSATF